LKGRRRDVIFIKRSAAHALPRIRGDFEDLLSPTKQVVTLDGPGAIQDASGRRRIWIVRSHRGCAKKVGAPDGLDFGNVGQAAAVSPKSKIGHPGLSLWVENAVIAGLANLRVGIVLLPQHRKPRRQVVHQQAGTEVIVGRQGTGKVKLDLGLFLLHLLSFAEKGERGLLRLLARPASGQVILCPLLRPEAIHLDCWCGGASGRAAGSGGCRVYL
jgi:hypothetical protein